MLSDNFEIYYYNDTSTMSVKNHTHNYYEFYFFIQGNMTMYIEDKAFNLQRGDIIVIPPDTQHHIQNLEPSVPYQRFVFWISKPYYDSLANRNPDYSYIINCAVSEKKYIYHNDLVDFNAYRVKFLRLLDEIYSKRFGHAERIILFVEDLIMHINRTAYESNNPVISKNPSSLCETILQYIEENPDEDLSLERLADIFFVSKYHISHIFKDNIGLSLHQYVIKKRLFIARDALLGGNDINTAYELSGFKDYSSFYRAFKKEFLVSPKEFQAECWVQEKRRLLR